MAMKMPKNLFYLGWVAFFMLLVNPTPGSPAEIAIVANEKFPEDQLTVGQVRNIYMGEIQILNSIRVYPIDQSYRQPIRKAFLRQIIGMNRDNYMDYWNKRLYRKGGITPLLEENSQDMLEAIQAKEGAIGYIWADEAPIRKNIKILLLINIP